VTLILALLAGCTPRPLTPPPPHDVRLVVILPPENRTSDDLLVSGGSMLEKYVFHSDRLTVADILAADTEELLRARGYRAGAAGKPLPTEGNLLDLEIQRWEPDSWTEPTFVIVGVTATLRDGASGRELWSAHPPIGPIATPGAVVLGSAYEIAARKIVTEIFASWPGPSP
jgi:hypothetical protein